jgi:hypothetical protein
MAFSLDSEAFEYKVFVFGHSIAKRIDEYATSFTAVLAIYFAGFVLTLALTFGAASGELPRSWSRNT